MGEYGRACRWSRHRIHVLCLVTWNTWKGPIGREQSIAGGCALRSGRRTTGFGGWAGV